MIAQSALASPVRCRQLASLTADSRRGRLSVAHSPLFAPCISLRLLPCNSSRSSRRLPLHAQGLSQAEACTVRALPTRVGPALDCTVTAADRSQRAAGPVAGPDGQSERASCLADRRTKRRRRDRGSRRDGQQQHSWAEASSAGHTRGTWCAAAMDPLSRDHGCRASLWHGSMQRGPVTSWTRSLLDRALDRGHRSLRLRCTLCSASIASEHRLDARLAARATAHFVSLSHAREQGAASAATRLPVRLAGRTNVERAVELCIVPSHVRPSARRRYATRPASPFATRSSAASLWLRQQ